jgi:GcrA cell cycle regulator
VAVVDTAVTFQWGNIMISEVTKHEQELLKLWEEGLSGKLIAEKLGVTRNAVMGKLHRLREQRVITYRNIATRTAAVRHSVRMKERAKKEPPKAPEPVEEKPILETVEDILPMILEELRPKDEDRKPVTFFNLDSSSCRYVVSGNLAKDFLFCNEVKRINGPYCDTHHARCNTPNIVIRKKVIQDDASA